MTDEDWKAGDVVAVRETIRKVTPDGNYLTGAGTCSVGRARRENVAPWLSSEEQALMEAVIEAARAWVASTDEDDDGNLDEAKWNENIALAEALEASSHALDAYRAKKEAPDAQPG